MIVSDRLDERRLVRRFRVLELDQNMSRRVVAHAIRQPRPLRCIPRIPLAPQEKNIRSGRVAQEFRLKVYFYLHLRQ